MAGTERIERARLEELVEAGMTIGEIAATLERSTITVRRWLGRYGLRTRASLDLERQRVAKEAGVETIERTCRHHGLTVFVIDRAGNYRCRRCRVESVTRRRRRVKEMLVDEAGGCCQLCGYSRYVGALQFHHVDPSEKRVGFAMGGIALAIDVFREEAQKCVLLCSNCHAEVEGGVTSLPVNSLPSLPIK